MSFDVSISIDLILKEQQSNILFFIYSQIQDQTPMVTLCNRQNLSNFELKSRKPGDRPDGRQNGQMGDYSNQRPSGGLLGNHFMPTNRGGGGYMNNSHSSAPPQLLGIGGASGRDGGGRPPLIPNRPQLRQQAPLLSNQPQLTSGGGAPPQRLSQYGGSGNNGSWPQLMPNGSRGGSIGGGQAPPGAINLNMLRMPSVGGSGQSGGGNHRGAGSSMNSNQPGLLSAPDVSMRSQLSASEFEN